jgi:hypothetical protein
MEQQIMNEVNNKYTWLMKVFEAVFDFLVDEQNRQSNLTK